MAKFGSLKWFIVIVAFLVLFAYHRRKTNQPIANSAEEMVQIPAAEADMTGQGYTAIPAPELVDDQPLADQELLTELETSDLEDPMLDFQEVNPEYSNEVIKEDLVQDGSETVVEESAVPMVDLPEKLPAPKSQIKESELADNANDLRTDQVSKNNVVRGVRLSKGVHIKAVHHIEYGKSLARRGAVYGAKQEFNAALRLIAQAIDRQHGSRQYSENLYRAMLVLDESDDFYFAQAENNGHVDVPAVGQRHQSKILSKEQLARLTPMEAMQAYYNFVQNQLVDCSGHTVVAGEALYCLGKLYDMNAKNTLEGSRLDHAKAIVYHSAALYCDPRNNKSANELGVLLAKSGRMEAAKKLLLRSLKIRQTPKVWENLAFIHTSLGEQRLAELANIEYQRMLNGPPAEGVRWISPEKFAAQSVEPVQLRTAHLPNVENTSQQDKPKDSSIKKMMKKLF